MADLNDSIDPSHTPSRPMIAPHCDVMRAQALGRRRFARGFSRVNLVVIVIVIVVLLVGAVLAMQFLAGVRRGAWELYDGGQIRGIHQSMALWAQNNSDAYPLPSRIDLTDETVAAQGRDKDTTANIFSILIYANYFSPELCVSPAETNPSIRVHETYAFRNPPAAVNPAKALWDPAFSADFTGRKIGNLSFAHMLPADERLEKTWTNTYNEAQAVIGSRGPEIKGVTTKGGTRTYTMPKKSNTFLIHGGKKTWEGNIVYNDNHVNFETSLTPAETMYKDAADAKQPDCLFFDETDDASKINNFLGIFTTAGATKAEYGGIWD